MSAFCSAPRRWRIGRSSDIGKATSWSGRLSRPHRGHGPPSLRQRFGQANVTSLVERVSRFTVILKNASKRSGQVLGKFITAIGAPPFAARRSVTFDRGSEFVTWPHLQAETGTRSWFCDPQSPHQKGAVENTSRRARRWLPRETDIRHMTDAAIREITDRMNATPRKCLG